MAATGVLARGWFRGRRGGWIGTASVLAAALVLLVLVAGLFQGIQRETESRVEDVYTSGLRITPENVGVFSGGTFNPATDALDALISPASMRMESQFVLRRGGFASEFLGDDQVSGCFVAGQECTDAVGLGVMVGLPVGDASALRDIDPYISHGSIRSWSGNGPVPIVMSTPMLERFLTESERAQFLPFDRTLTCNGHLRFELTAGVFTSDKQDVHRAEACLSGVYETRVQQLDTLTIFGPIEGARHILGHAPTTDVANVMVVHALTQSAGLRAESQGWAVEGGDAFTDRYLGQLIEALRVLSLVAVVVLFTVPAFLVAHGVERVLQEQRREVAVLRALGAPNRTFRRALARLVAGMTLGAGAAAAIIATIAATALGALLPRWDGSPLPLGVHVTLGIVAGAAAVAVLSVAFAYVVAVRTLRRIDLAPTLRTA